MESDTDPQNENESFETYEDALEYYNAGHMDRIIKVDYTDMSEEVILERGEDEDDE